jgi:hypothetical protein
VPDIPSHVTGSGEGNDGPGRQEASKNITQQMSPEHANSSQTISHYTSHQTFITQQPKGIAGFEDSSNNFNITIDMKNDLNISPKENTNRSDFQQSEYIRTTEEMQRYSSNSDQSDPIIVFPWNMAGTSDPTELETVYLIYPKDGDENDTDAWSWNMNDDLLSSNTAELRLLEPDYKNSTNLTETPKASSIIEQISAENIDMPEKEYLVASRSEYNRIQARNEMQENYEDQVDDDDDDEDEEDGEERDVDEDDNNNGHENNENQVVSPTSGHILTEHMQSKRPNVPKRSFVSENLKMRISQLVAREGRPGPRGNPEADEARSTNSRYHTGQRSSQLFNSMRVIEKQSASHRETGTNRSPRPSPLLDTSVDRITARPHPLRRLSSNIKNSTGISEDTMAIPRASRPRNTFSRQLDRNRTEGSVIDTNISQQGSRLRQESVQRQLQQGEHEAIQYRQTYVRENSERTANTNLIKTADNPKDGNSGNHTNNTKQTGAQEIQTHKSDPTGVVENIRPVVRRKMTETLHGTFGARTRTRDRPSSFQMSPSHARTKIEGGTGSVITKFVHNHPTGEGVTEPRPSKQEGPQSPATTTTVMPPGSDTRQSVNGDISGEGAGLINVVGPVPKGFTDPAVPLQDMDSINQRDPLFHLPYNIQPQPFLNQISNSEVPQISTSVTHPSSGVPSFNPGVSVFHQPQAQSLQQHDVLRHAVTRPLQKYIHTITATPNSPNAAHFNRHEWQAAQQNWLPSNQQADFDAPQVQSPLTAHKFNHPSARNIAEFNKPLPLHLPTRNDPQKTTSTHVPVAVIHSSPNDETIRAKIVPLSQTSPLQKFLSFSDQQLKQPGEQNESFVSPSTHGSQPSTKPPAEGRPAPQLFALYQQDARRHTAQLEYTKKLQEYFQQLQNYYNQQHHK